MSEKNEKTNGRVPKLSEINPAVVQQIQINQTVRCLRMLMASMHIDPERAMALLQIPTKERKSYRAILTNLKAKRQAKPSTAKAAVDAGTVGICDAEKKIADKH